MSKKVKVLLLKPLPPKGNAGDTIEVKVHFALHVLFPKGIAVAYTKQVENQRQAQMKKIELNKAGLLTRITEVVGLIREAGGITFKKEASEAKSLYDSISTKTLAQYIDTTYGIKIAASHFEMENKIESLGEYEVAFSYENINVKLPVHVVANTPNTTVAA